MVYVKLSADFLEREESSDTSPRTPPQLDISTLNLTSLRQRITLLPQEAVLFSGTIRSNLDPFDDHSVGPCHCSRSSCDED